MRGTATKMKKVEEPKPEVILPDKRNRNKDAEVYAPIRIDPKKPLMAFRVNGRVPVYTSMGEQRMRDGELLFVSEGRSWFGDGSPDALVQIGYYEKKPT